MKHIKLFKIFESKEIENLKQTTFVDAVKYLNKTDKKQLERILKSDKKYVEFISKSSRNIYDVKAKLTNRMQNLTSTFEITEDFKKLVKSYL